MPADVKSATDPRTTTVPRPAMTKKMAMAAARERINAEAAGNAIPAPATDTFSTAFDLRLYPREGSTIKRLVSDHSAHSAKAHPRAIAEFRHMLQTTTNAPPPAAPLALSRAASPASCAWSRSAGTTPSMRSPLW